MLSFFSFCALHRRAVFLPNRIALVAGDRAPLALDIPTPLALRLGTRFQMIVQAVLRDLDPVAAAPLLGDGMLVAHQTALQPEAGVAGVGAAKLLIGCVTALAGAKLLRHRTIEAAVLPSELLIGGGTLATRAKLDSGDPARAAASAASPASASGCRPEWLLVPEIFGNVQQRQRRWLIACF